MSIVKAIRSIIQESKVVHTVDPRVVPGSTVWHTVKAPFVHQGPNLPCSGGEVIGVASCTVDVSGNPKVSRTLLPDNLTVNGVKPVEPHPNFYYRSEEDCILGSLQFYRRKAREDDVLGGEVTRTVYLKSITNLERLLASYRASK